MNYKDYIKKNNKKNFNILNIIVIIIIIVIIGFILVPLIFKKDGIKLNEKITYKVKINSNGSNTSTKTLSCFTYTDKCKVNLPVIKRDGYEILGFSNKDNSYDIVYNSGEQIEIDSDMELYVITKKEVTLSLVNMNDNSISSLKCNLYNNDINCQIKLPNESSNLIFQGWSDEIGSKKADYIPNQTIYLDNDKRIYSVFSKEVTVTLINNDESSKLTCLIEGNETSCNIKLPNISKEGWEVLGWSLNINSKKVDYNNLDTINVTDNISLYAVLKKSFNIVFVSNGASIENNILKCELYNNDDTCEVTFPNIVRNGYEILGWSENKNANIGTYNAQNKIKLNKQKTYYAISRKKVNVSFLSSNYASVNNNVVSCYMYNGSKDCQINTPNVSVLSGEFAGWSKIKNSKNIDYKGNSINVSNDITLYPVTKKIITISFDKNGGTYIDYESKLCELYNGDTNCNIVIPNVDKPGMISFGFDENKNINSNPKYLSNEAYSFTKSTILYANFSSATSGYRNIEVYDQKKYNKLTLEIDKSCSYDEIERKVNKLYSDWPSLFNYNVKVTYLSESNFVRIHNMTDAVGITFGRENKDKYLPKIFVDLVCSSNGDVFIHEMTHYHDFMYELKYKTYLSSSYEVSSLYNKYVNMSNRPMRDYSYSNKQEFMAEMAMWYYNKHYLGGNIYLPDDIENYVVQNLKKNVE